jgi:uncharacterized membrane protein YeaQ/YmgE (transglycosylase-associated protein family)
MQETARMVLHYFLSSAILCLVIAFIAGFAASKTVAYEGKAGFVLYLLVGVFGLFLGEFVLFFYGLLEYLKNVSEFRLLFDLIVAYVGSFVVAAVVHFIKPM